jgi:predicted ATP-grasp superfamily ATP-dependent carboligase
LDTVLGYKGNYMIFALRENNFLTLHMMQDYLDVSDGLLLRDPDEVGNYTVEALQELAACVRQRDPKLYERYRDVFKQLLIKRLSSGQPEDDLVVVPASGLYIEALVGTHPLLEDFKLVHRAVDVKKVQAEVRHAELENIRLAARALKGKDEDPDIEKKIVIQANGSDVTVADGG